MHHTVRILAAAMLGLLAWCPIALAGEKLIIIREPGKPVEVVTKALASLLDALRPQADEFEVYFVNVRGKLGEAIPSSGWDKALEEWPKQRKWNHAAVLKHVDAKEDIVILAGHGQLFPEIKTKTMWMKSSVKGISFGKKPKPKKVTKFIPQNNALKKVLAQVGKLYLLHDNTKLHSTWKKGCGKCVAKRFKASEVDGLIKAIGIESVINIDPDDPELIAANPKPEIVKIKPEEGNVEPEITKVPQKVIKIGATTVLGSVKSPPPPKTLPIDNIRETSSQSGSGGMLIAIGVGGILAFALALFFAYPWAYQLRGRLILKDAYGPSKFDEAKLLGITWRTREIEVDVPCQEGVLVGLRVRRLPHHKRVRVSFVLRHAGKLTNELVAVLEPGDRERYGDLIVDYQPASSVPV